MDSLDRQSTAAMTIRYRLLTLLIVLVLGVALWLTAGIAFALLASS
jgi:hypothetical protein